MFQRMVCLQVRNKIGCISSMSNKGSVANSTQNNFSSLVFITKVFPDSRLYVSCFAIRVSLLLEGLFKSLLLLSVEAGTEWELEHEMILASIFARD